MKKNIVSDFLPIKSIFNFNDIINSFKEMKNVFSKLGLESSKHIDQDLNNDDDYDEYISGDESEQGPATIGRLNENRSEQKPKKLSRTSHIKSTRDGHLLIQKPTTSTSLLSGTSTSSIVY